MKKICSILVIIMMSASLFAQQEGIEYKSKKKTEQYNKPTKRYGHFKESNISKTYPASGNTLQIDNQFGAVKVITWDKNEIKVDVHIEASSDKEEVAEKTFNSIQVEESKQGNSIQFKTKLGDDKGNNYNCKNCTSTMEISYTIQLPASTPLKIYNQFGSTTVPDYNGALTLVSKFGTLITGSLSRVEKLWVEFGKTTIKSLNNAAATFKFTEVIINNLSGSNTIKMEFCGSGKIVLGNDLASLQLTESYSTVNLKPVSDFSAAYRIRTSFSTLKNRSNAGIKRTDEPDRYGPDSEKEYEGKSGSGASKIDIKSSFGTIIIGEATTEEMKEKKEKAEAKI
ncbi:MAG: hypothetical protein K2X48_16120 [Chitinophagaceae bacterium]|nr:hypothetical protein [Chitinophagaceae bacterium]